MLMTLSLHNSLKEGLQFQRKFCAQMENRTKSKMGRKWYYVSVGFPVRNKRLPLCLILNFELSVKNTDLLKTLKVQIDNFSNARQILCGTLICFILSRYGRVFSLEVFYFIIITVRCFHQMWAFRYRYSANQQTSEKLAVVQDPSSTTGIPLNQWSNNKFPYQRSNFRRISLGEALIIQLLSS